jgi:hypothetical protein
MNGNINLRLIDIEKRVINKEGKSLHCIQALEKRAIEYKKAAKSK